MKIKNKKLRNKKRYRATIMFNEKDWDLLDKSRSIAYRRDETLYRFLTELLYGYGGEQ